LFLGEIFQPIIENVMYHLKPPPFAIKYATNNRGVTQEKLKVSYVTIEPIIYYNPAKGVALYTLQYGAVEHCQLNGYTRRCMCGSLSM